MVQQLITLTFPWDVGSFSISYMMVHNISSRKSDKHFYHSQATHTLLHRQTCSHIQTCQCHQRIFFIQQTAVMKKMTIGLCREQEITAYSVLNRHAHHFSSSWDLGNTSVEKKRAYVSILRWGIACRLLVISEEGYISFC